MRKLFFMCCLLAIFIAGCNTVNFAPGRAYIDASAGSGNNA
ncbi:MAG: hypothetical protein Q8L78_02850 [Coxiellaceae bacterium]|nr:hypothetical protein [Coxiellaceae bacterium]